MNQLLDNRIQALLDGTIIESEFKKLEDELASNPEARKLYYSYVALNQGLDYRLSRTSQIAPSPNTHNIQRLAESRLKRQRTRAHRWSLASAAAIVLITLVTMRFFFIQSDAPEPKLEFATSPGTLFTLTHNESENTPEGLILQKESRLQISQGAVELNFTTGVRAIVLGPADITLHDDNQLYMSSGIGWFHVPKQAQGFTVVTRELNIIDLGTKFGVISDPLKDDEVHVIQGKVKVEALHGVKKDTLLTTGQAAAVRPFGRFHTKKLQPETFPTQLPQTLPYMHWTFDEPHNLLSHHSLNDTSDISYYQYGTSNPSLPPHPSPGPFGNAAVFDGSNDYLETDWQGILGRQPRTVAFWLKNPRRENPPPTRHTETIIAWGYQQELDHSTANVNSKWTIHLKWDTNQQPLLHVSFGGFWFYHPEPIFSEDAWHHVTVVYTGQSDINGYPETRIYVDAEEIKCIPDAHNPTLRNADNHIIINTIDHTPLTIGANLPYPSAPNINRTTLLQAEIDELFIIEGVISKDSVRQLMIENRLNHIPATKHKHTH